MKRRTGLVSLGCGSESRVKGEIRCHQRDRMDLGASARKLLLVGVDGMASVIMARDAGESRVRLYP